VLAGVELAARAGIEDRLVTNQERLQSICKTLSDDMVPPLERLRRAAPLVTVADAHRFVADRSLRIETLLGATRLGVKVLLEGGVVEAPELRSRMEAYVKATRTNEHLEQLEALRLLKDAVGDRASPAGGEYVQSVKTLVDLAWGYVFMHYFWLKQKAGSRDG
jgi:hypothetical protein